MLPFSSTCHSWVGISSYLAPETPGRRLTETYWLFLKWNEKGIQIQQTSLSWSLREEGKKQKNNLVPWNSKIKFLFPSISGATWWRMEARNPPACRTPCGIVYCIQSTWGLWCSPESAESKRKWSRGFHGVQRSSFRTSGLGHRQTGMKALTAAG